MIRTTEITAKTALIVLDAAAAKRAAHAAKERARRAKIKAAKAAAAEPTVVAEATFAPLAVLAASAFEDVAAEISSEPVAVPTVEGRAEVPTTICPPPKALQEVERRRAVIERAAEQTIAQRDAAEGKDTGLCETRIQALSLARLRYGIETADEPRFTVKRTARGEWYWGPFDVNLLPTVERALHKAKAVKKEAPALGLKAKAERQPAARGERRADGLAAGSKKAIMLDMVLAEGGATEQEICDAIGWKACLVTLKRVAAEVKATLRAEKVKGERTRYFATRAA